MCTRHTDQRRGCAAAGRRPAAQVGRALSWLTPKTPLLSESRCQFPVDLRVLEDLALLAFAPEVGSKEEGLHTRLGHFLVDSSRVSWSGVEGWEVEAGEACGVEEDVHGRDPPVVHREGADRVEFSVEH